MSIRKAIGVNAEEKIDFQAGYRVKQLIWATFTILRPKQWVKNLFLFAGLIFSENVFDFQLVLITFIAFVSFCLMSGTVYVINDIVDVNEDKLHPNKRNRPLPKAYITSIQAVLIALTAFSISLILAWNLGFQFTIIVILYFALTTAYTFWFKHMVIIDIFAISAGFLLRVIAGTVVIGVEISPWLLICTLLISLFLALIKRRHENISLENGGTDHRRVLADYSVGFIDQMISIITAATIMAYSLYTFTSGKTEFLMLTIPFVIYGLLRYLYLVHKREMGGSPEEVLLKDKPLLINIGLWVILCIAILYVDKLGII